MRIAFLGTPAVAVPALEAFVAADDIDVAAVITNPDRPRGRRGTPQPPPVKLAAEQAGLDVWQPAKPREIVEDLHALAVDACAVVAYGSLLPTPVLEAAGAGMVNLHFSLLPRWRGAAPVQHALRAGDRVTGVTTFVLDEGMDTGPVLDRLEVEVGPEESAGQLLDRLAHLGAPLLVASVRRLVDGAVPTPQAETGATLAPKIRTEDVAIDLGDEPQAIADLVRSADPTPGAHTTFRGKRLKVLRVQPLTGEELGEVLGQPAPDVADDVPPGEVLGQHRGVVVAAGSGALRLLEVQPEGKGRMDGIAFANGYQPHPGERLGDAG